MANKSGGVRRVWVCTVCGHKQDVHPDTRRPQCSICKKLLMVLGSFDAVDQGARLDVLNHGERITKLENDFKQMLGVLGTLLKTVEQNNRGG